MRNSKNTSDGEPASQRGAVRELKHFCSPERTQLRLEEAHLDWRNRVGAAGGALDIFDRVNACLIASEAKDQNNFAFAIDLAVRTFGAARARQRISDDTVEAVVSGINHWFRRRHPISVDDFRDVDPPGSEPVRAFVDWLRTDRPKARDWTGLLKKTDPSSFSSFAKLGARRDRAKECLDFFKGCDSRTIRVVSQEGMAEGLRSLANFLVHDAIRREPELYHHSICYLPVTRDPETGSRITLPHLVGYLRAFYAGDSPADAEPPRDAATLREALTEVRRKMISRSTLFIMDGFNAQNEALPALDAMIADDALTALLREVIHPLVGELEPTQDIRTFYRNRFLVLANGGLSGFEAFCGAPTVLDAPDRDDLKPLLAINDRKHEDDILDAYRRPAMRSDATIGVIETLAELRTIAEKIKPSVVGMLTTGGLSTQADAYAALAKYLKAENPVALFALRMAALVRGGVRYGTIIRLIDQWRKLEHDPLTEQFRLPLVSDTAALTDALKGLEGILVSGRDEFIAGFDDVHEPFVYLNDETWVSNPDEAARRRHSLDLRSSHLRGRIVEDLAREPGWVIARYHRLLAEECLRQQTLVMRHAEWRGSADPRYFRRLCQMLFHGFASLSAGPEEMAAASRAAPAVLPIDPGQTYRRLFGVFFRTLMENPPHNDLSRSLGRDALKVDLIILAMHAGRPALDLWQELYDRGGRLPPAASPFLDHRTAEWRDFEILADQYRSLAHASYQTGDLTQMWEALDKGQSVPANYLIDPHEQPPAMKAFISKFQPDINRLWIDLYLLNSLELAEKKLAEARQDVGFDRPRRLLASEMPPHPIAEPPATMEKALEAILNGLALATSPTEATAMLAELADWFVKTYADKSTADEIGAWASILIRQGEYDAIRADEMGGAPRVRALYRAFVKFYIAERLRRAAFDTDPLGRSFVVQGHGSRVLVRIALQLLRAISRPDDGGGDSVRASLPDRDFFIAESRRHIDMLTRYFARYPSERPSLLILQATFTRSVGTGDSNHMLAALNLLDEADNLMFMAPDRPRIRWRLMLERIKVLGQLIAAAHEKRTAAGGTVDHWAALAAYDLVRLTWQVTGRGHSVWEHRVKRQVDLFADLRDKLGLDNQRLGLDIKDWQVISGPSLSFV